MKIQIPTLSNKDLPIQLTDISGQLVKSIVIHKGNKNASLDIETIKEEIYFVQYYDSGYQVTKKVMILRN